MLDHHSAYRHGLAADQRLRHAPPTSSANGWDLRPGLPAPRPRVVPMVLTALTAASIFGAGLIAWCVL